MTQVRWTNDRVKLGSLKPWERNPRYSTEDDAAAIVESHEMWGQSDIICIDLENNVLNGHQRLSAWLAKYRPDFEVDVRRADRIFDEAEKQAFTAFMHAKAVGRFDWQEIANWGWDADEYRSFGFDEDFAKTRHEEAFAVESMLVSGEDWNDAFDGLPDGDRTPFQQMTFTLHDTQVEKVKEALSLAKNNDFSNTPNENSNGNALAFICETFIDG